MKKKKLISGILFCASAMTFGLAGCGADPTLDLYQPENDYIVAPGDTLQLATRLSGIKEEDVTYSVTGSATINESGLLTALLMAIVPGYISRSVAGSYDNEAVAIFALIATFYLFVKALNTGSILWGTICALMASIISAPVLQDARPTHGRPIS